MSMTEKKPGRIVGIDYGEVRIGIAITDPQQQIASPLITYVRRGARQDAQYFRRLAQDEEVQRFIVGLPLSLDGGESRKSIEARKFGKWLAEVTNLPVKFFDERYTTVQAEQLMLQADLSRKSRKRRVDKLAAQIMLQAYLESRQKDRRQG